MTWKKVKLKEVLKQYRVQHIVQNDIEYKQVTISKYNGVTFRGTKIGKEIGRKRQFIIDLKRYPNTLMLVRQGVQDGSIGIAPIEVDGCIATENMPMFSIEGIDLEYLRFLLKSPYFYDELNKIETTGSAQKSIHERQILEIEIPLPDIVKQKELVKELIKIKNDSFKISNELNCQLRILKQLRQAFLREAMQGKLIKSTNTKETGQQLLEKIKAEKAQLIADKKLKKEKELPPIGDDENIFEIPEHWVVTTIENIAANKKNALKAGPFGSSLKKEFYVKTGYKIYGQEQVINNDAFFGDYYIDQERFDTLKSCEVKAGDILISLVGTMGKVLILPDGIKKGIINPRLVKLSLFKDIDRDFFKFYLYSDIAIKQINHFSHGSTMNIINLGIIKKLIFPLPPLDEQQQIVINLERLMKYCDDLEISIKESQFYNNQLLQQVLREALQPKEGAVIDSLFENKSYDLYVAMMQKLIENQLNINYGEVATQKTIFHLNTFTDEKIPYSFINSNYGTYSYQLKDDLTKNPYLTKSKIGSGEVFVIKTNKEKEIKDALAKPENKSFVDAVKKVLTIYENPVINKETEKVELLNTVSKMMIDFQTSDLEAVYEGMRNWEIKQKGFKNKAEKFNKAQTKGMISLIEKLGLVKNLIA